MDSPHPARPTAQTVANRAGVSPSTVSLVLNERGSFTAETRERVLAAARSLGYQHQARQRNKAVREAPGRLISVFWFPDQHTGEYPSIGEILQSGVSAYARKAGYRVRVSYLTGEDDLPGSATGMFQGVLVGGDPPPSVLVTDSHFHSILGVHVHRNSGTCSIVNCDEEWAGFELAQYLVNKGHHRISFLNPDPGYPGHMLRQRGYRHALEQAGLTPDPLPYPASSRQRLERASDLTSRVEGILQSWFRHPSPPTAVVAACDRVAAVVYRYCFTRKIRIPQDVSVVGCDDDQSIGTVLHPPLTTYRMPYFRMGEMAARELCQQMESKSNRPPFRYLLRGWLVERASCLPAGSVTSNLVPDG